MGNRFEKALIHALLVAVITLAGCSYDDSYCEWGYTVITMEHQDIFDVYADEEDVRFLRKWQDGRLDTLVFTVQLDTVMEEDYQTCGWCDALLEKVVVRFRTETDSFEMRVIFMPCDRYQLHVGNKIYNERYYKWQRPTAFGADSFYMNDSLGLCYYAKGSQYQLTALH